MGASAQGAQRGGGDTARAPGNANDFLEVLVYQNSGATIYVCGSSLQYTTFSMVRMGL